MNEWARDHWLATSVLIVIVSAFVANTIIETAKVLRGKR